jgi:hypothetical protein
MLARASKKPKSLPARPTRTPGMRYFLRQQWPSTRWQVLQISEAQAQALLERGERTYSTSAQAYAIARKLNSQGDIT